MMPPTAAAQMRISSAGAARPSGSPVPVLGALVVAVGAGSAVGCGRFWRTTNAPPSTTTTAAAPASTGVSRRYPDRPALHPPPLPAPDLARTPKAAVLVASGK